MWVQTNTRYLAMTVYLVVQSVFSAPAYDVWIDDPESGSGEMSGDIEYTSQVFTQTSAKEILHLTDAVTISESTPKNSQHHDLNLNPDKTTSQTESNSLREDHSEDMTSGLMIGLMVAAAIFVLTAVALVILIIYRYRGNICRSRKGKADITYTQSRDIYFKPTLNEKDDVTSAMDNPVYGKAT